MRLSLHHLLCGLAAVAFALAAPANLAPAADTPAAPAASPTTATAPAPGDAAKNGQSGQDGAPSVPLLNEVHPVKLVKADNGKWQLLRDDKPYFIKGVGGDGNRETLVKLGGNSIRIWGIDPKATPVELNDDAKNGLTAALGYWVGHKDNGFKADDPAAVKAQLEEFKRVVKIYKDHPAVLLWAIGNEMENGNDTPALWQSIEDLAKAAHEIDPNHPTMTVVAEVGGQHVGYIHKYCPSIDIVGINSYAGGQNVGDRYLKQAGATPKPYVITEFGPPGQWEYWSKSKFGALNEMTSTEKAAWYKNSYEKTVLAHPGECLGSYAFIWGYKLEATSTWYGMFLPDGSKTAAVDVMQEEWSGKKTDTPCPVMKKLAINGPNEVKAGDVVKASIDASDPSGGKLKYDWALVRDMGTYDVQEPGAVGPPSYPDALAKNGEAEASFTMPKVNGVYRIYGYVRNDTGGAALCSLPVKVTGGEAAPFKAPKANLPFVVVGEGKAPKNYIPSGYMGDNKFVKMADSTDNPHAGKTSLKCTFTVTTGPDGKGWQCPDATFDATKLTGKGGVVWQSPVNDWGTEPGGYDFTGAKQVTFWARGEKGGETVRFGIGFLTREREAGKQYYDSEKVQISLTLTNEWKLYTIDLAGKNLSVIKSGFFWEAQAAAAPATLYLSEIKYD